jgi:hypothetical protein
MLLLLGAAALALGAGQATAPPTTEVPDRGSKPHVRPQRQPLAGCLVALLPVVSCSDTVLLLTEPCH